MLPIITANMHLSTCYVPGTMLPNKIGIICVDITYTEGFPGGSAGKESTCNSGDPGSIPGLERSPEEGIGYPLQYSWASPVAQTIENLPAMRDTWV